jgi:transmembrane 9 superfamily protein 2/4
MAGGQIHWFAILNSVVIVLFLSGMVAMILLRTLHRDIAKYNELATAEEQAEETGWKLVHGDVFRKPPYFPLLAVSVGSGMQILGMSVVTLFFALLGILSPANRGGLLQSMMLLFTFMGMLGGYTAARFCKLFDGDDWKITTLLTACLYPGLFFGIFFVLNLLIWGQKSSGAVPFTTMFALLVLWFGISVPLVYLGSYSGFRRASIELPVRTKTMPRQIPEKPWFANSIFLSLVGGLLPFGAVFTELFFIMSSLWQHQFYYLFGFLALVLVILIITCAEISIALTYFQLTSEDYQWWWRSFAASGASAVYVFVYAMYYFSSRLQIEKVVSTLLYFGYMSIISIMFSLLTGSIGLVASFYFVKAIYGSIKID